MQIINLDISQIPEGKQPVLWAKQGEVGRKFKAVITDNGEPYNIHADAVASVWYAGTAGEGNYTHISDHGAAVINGNEITVELITQMLTVSGGGLLSLALNRGDGSLLGLWNIHYWVEPVPGADSEAAQTYYNAFSKTAAEALAAAQKLTIPIPVQHGGTGAQDPATAVANLGAAPTVHDHSGQLITPGAIDVNADHNWPRIMLRNKNSQDSQMTMQFDCTTKQAFFALETPTGGFGEYYTLPALSATQTEWYDIITTKNPATARTQLGLQDIRAYSFNDGDGAGGWISTLQENWYAMENGTFVINAGYSGQRAAFFGYKAGDYGIALLIAYSTTNVVLYRNVNNTWTERTI